MSEITRRDFINGTLVVAGSSLLPFGASGQDVLAALEPSYYPPALTGLRGSHPGSNLHAHEPGMGSTFGLGTHHRFERRVRPGRGWRRTQRTGGCILLPGRSTVGTRRCSSSTITMISGATPRRNEHTIDGHTRITYGGSQTLVDPRDGSEVVLDLFRDIGVDLERFETAYDRRLLQKEQSRGCHLLQQRSVWRRQGRQAPLLQLSELRGRASGRKAIQRRGCTTSST